MKYLWLFLVWGIASCENDINMKKDVTDFLNDLSVRTSEDNVDHSAHHMDHSSHGSHTNAGQHGKDDHSGHHDHGAGHHMMMMWFHGGCNEVILFDFWRIDSCCGLILSCVAIFIMGAAYEGLKWFRIYLQIQYGRCATKQIPVSVTANSACHKSLEAGNGAEPLVSAHGRANIVKARSAFSMPRLIQGSLYVVQLILAYWLMLIVMTYNSWLSIAVVLGAGFGHWLFAVLELDSVDGAAADSFATDACH
ncbi:unnamed protein product [Caenorhabditis bovis]|uniref:Copper transport protein n=1 Tax=Caenorhabditis bovis TaxID=2654633 RepID=A0A8S1EI27_9PELO|nr:unnamed protein product [Caenorhabditis bovis]